MKSVAEFLNNLDKVQPSVLKPSLVSATDYSRVELDSSLKSAVMRGWHIAPVLARSKYFSRTAIAGYPTVDLIQLSHWDKEYSPSGCNWAVETGLRSHLLILEFDYATGRKMLRELSNGDWGWQSSLQFSDPSARFVCFRYSGQRVRALGRDFPGIRIHLGNCILIPNSKYVDNSEISYLNPHARVLDLPNWLLYVVKTAGEAKTPVADDEASDEAA
jgi:hypothetical protein